MFLMINNFFLIPTLISIVILSSTYIFRKKLFTKYKIFWISIVICFVIYLFFVGSSLIEDVYFSYKVNSFINIDGTFEYEKLNSEQKYYTERLINDLSRNLSVVFGFIISFSIAIIYFSIAQLIIFLKKRFKSYN